MNNWTKEKLKNGSDTTNISLLALLFFHISSTSDFYNDSSASCIGDEMAWLNTRTSAPMNNEHITQTDLGHKTKVLSGQLLKVCTVQ